MASHHVHSIQASRWTIGQWGSKQGLASHLTHT